MYKDFKSCQINELIKTEIMHQTQVIYHFKVVYIFKKFIDTTNIGQLTYKIN